MPPSTITRTILLLTAIFSINHCPAKASICIAATDPTSCLPSRCVWLSDVVCVSKLDCSVIVSGCVHKGTLFCAYSSGNDVQNEILCKQHHPCKWQNGQCSAPATPEPTAFAGSLCYDGCPFNNDGKCDDGGIGSTSGLCPFGSDCADCGIRIEGQTLGITSFPSSQPSRRPVRKSKRGGKGRSG